MRSSPGAYGQEGGPEPGEHSRGLSIAHGRDAVGDEGDVDDAPTNSSLWPGCRGWGEGTPRRHAAVFAVVEEAAFLATMEAR